MYVVDRNPAAQGEKGGFGHLITCFVAQGVPLLPLALLEIRPVAVGVIYIIVGFRLKR